MVRASAPFSFVEWSNRDSLAPLLRPLRAVGAAIGPMLDKQVSRQGVCYLLTFGATLLIAFMNPKVRDAVRCSCSTRFVCSLGHQVDRHAIANNKCTVVHCGDGCIHVDVSELGAASVS